MEDENRTRAQLVEEITHLRHRVAELEALLANKAAVAIENKQLYREMQRLAAFNEGIVQNMAEGLVVEDADGLLTYVNPAAANLLGYDTADDLVGQHWTTIIPPDQRAAVQAANERRARGNTDRYELEMARADGGRISVLVGGSPRRGVEGDFAGTMAVFTDITELKRAEDALRESERQKELILNATSEMVAYYDSDLRVIWANNASAKSVGKTSEELVGLHCYEIWHQRDVPCEDCPVLKARDKKSPQQAEQQTPDGRMWFLRGYPVLEDDGEVVALVEFGQDITERKEMEQALRESEEKYRALYENAPLSYQSLDVDGCVLDVNPTWLKTLGYERSEVIGKRFVRLLHPDSRSQFETNLQIFKQRGYISGVQYRIRHKRGHYLDVFFEGRIGYRPDGSVRQTYCVFQDITERKQMELALRESEARNRAILNALPDLMFVQSRDGTYLDYHASQPDVLYVPPEQFLGRQMADVLPSEVASVLLDSIEQAIATGDMQVSEYRLPILDQPRYFEARVVPYGSDRVLSIIREITERHEAEQALRASEARERARAVELEVMMDAVPAIVWIARDPDCHHVTGNRASYRLLRVEGGVNTSLTPVDGEPPSHFRFCRNGEEIPPNKLPMQMVCAHGMPIKNYEEEVVFSDGSRRYIFGNAVPLMDEDGQVRGALSAFVDITERKEMEQALRASEARFRDLAWQNARLLEQAREDARTKETLLQEVNHRVKNNLAAIIGLVQAERRRDAVVNSLVCQRSMTALATRIRGLALVHDMLSAAKWTPLRLEELTHRIILSIAQVLPSDKELIFDITPSPAQVSHRLANSMALVINELATNAAKYALGDDGKAHVRVDISVEDDVVTFLFRDDGPGYPEEILQGAEHSVGLYLISALVRHDLRGELVLENDGGAVAQIRFMQKRDEN